MKRLILWLICIILAAWIVICYFVIPYFKNDNSDSLNGGEEELLLPSEMEGLTSSQAFSLINNRKKELNYASWDITSATIKAEGDNDCYWVSYTSYNYSGYPMKMGVIICYKNDKWDFELPGFTGLTSSKKAEYNFVDVESEQYVELSSELAMKLINSKRKLAGDDTWTASNVRIVYKGDDNYYYVVYQENSNSGDTNVLGVIFHFDGKSWNFELPGNSTLTEDVISKYNFQENV